MFRNPRENVLRRSTSPFKPSVGRPPSPPPTPDEKHRISMPAMTTRIQTRSSPAASPIQSKPGTLLEKTTPLKNGKPKAKPNGSILNFFKKADSNHVGANGTIEGLFIDEGASHSAELDLMPMNFAHVDGLQDETEAVAAQRDVLNFERYNEHEISLKRRRLSSSSLNRLENNQTSSNQQKMAISPIGSPTSPNAADQTADQSRRMDSNEPQQGATVLKRHRGPFIEDSDSESELPLPRRDLGVAQSDDDITLPTAIHDTRQLLQNVRDREQQIQGTNVTIPTLRQELTSVAEGDGFEGFEGMDDFDDEYIEGEEFVERRWMREQRMIELAEQGIHVDVDGDFEDLEMIENPLEEIRKADSKQKEDPTVSSCPVCNAHFEGVSDQEASVHVNHCLDGNPTPLPAPKSDIKPEARLEPDMPLDRVHRLPRPAKPGQESPFQLGNTNGSASAFSKIMSGHAEDAAWASAAAAEYAARGRPAYQRTCPFYKILPGFFICVDAFRYGAVQGCEAYFLSHFHSDHYVGLTSTWSHGPIYCSRATGNLVRQQLRVDPKWVVDLEFERKVEVPGTQGVHVTMIPANHCPGSAIFMFEKVIGQGKNPKVQRVLHCGDFRACPAHVEHPLLRPDAMDIITRKTFQQKIDVCYLDTTYLNPRYSFPSQEDVIKACADMCVSLNKSKVDDQDGWEQMKKERAGSGMVKFVQKDPIPTPNEAAETSGSTGISTANSDTKPARGRLLVVVGTYSIGKERICLGIARALGSKIYAPPSKQRICACLEDAELNEHLTTNPREAQVHMTPLFEIRAETLGDYLAEHRTAGFTRAVGFRPSGWNYRPPNSRFTESPAVATVLHSESWKSGFSMKDLVPQRGSTSRASCFGVPYSEHSSFRELTMFCCALRIERVIPTVNVGSAKTREKMKGWVEKWAAERKKNGLFKVAGENGKDGWYAGQGTMELRTTL